MTNREEAEAAIRILMKIYNNEELSEQVSLVLMRQNRYRNVKQTAADAVKMLRAGLDSYSIKDDK